MLPFAVLKDLWGREESSIFVVIFLSMQVAWIQDMGHYFYLFILIKRASTIFDVWVFRALPSYNILATAKHPNLHPLSNEFCSRGLMKKSVNWTFTADLHRSDHSSQHPLPLLFQMNTHFSLHTKATMKDTHALLKVGFSSWNNLCVCNMSSVTSSWKELHKDKLQRSEANTVA